MGKLRKIGRPDMEDCNMDMSPMIDMVFQLIIFFMVTATLITIRKDPDVIVPVAPKGKRTDSAAGRVLVNVYSDDKMREKGRNSPFATEKGEELTYDKITELMRVTREANEKLGIKPTILYLRGDHHTMVRRTKEVLQAAGEGGVNDVIFSAFSEATTDHQ